MHQPFYEIDIAPANVLHLHWSVLGVGSHIRIDARRQALDALDKARRAPAGRGNGDGGNDAEIETVVEGFDELTSQSAVARIAARR